MATVAETLLTAEEFRQLLVDGVLRELVRGKVVPMNLPVQQHGRICGKVARILGRFLDVQDVGDLYTNDCGVVTEHNPDTVRGADVAFYSYARLPKGPLPTRYVDVMPELVFEVLSPTDRWRDVRVKTAEYLTAGVTTVCVLDPNTRTIHLYNNDLPDRAFTADQELTVPEVLGDFRAAVRLFFE
jgi:Uma2 family endonuclease